MNLQKHIIQQPFIFATGFAALVHSTWSLAVLFSGEPPAWEPLNPYSYLKMAYFWLPALLIAFAMDVGQISTSAQIRAGQKNWQKYATFIVLALFGYYLQWTYIVHHMPALALGEGVYPDGFAGSMVLLMRNAAVWVIPALLPLSTILYTLSEDEAHEIPTPVTIVTEQAAPMSAPAATHTHVLAESVIESPPQSASIVTEHPVPDQEYTAVCSECDWESGRTYLTQLQADRALNAHGRTCKAKHPELYISANGHHKD
jgi:hypothetical protein